MCAQVDWGRDRVEAIIEKVGSLVRVCSGNGPQNMCKSLQGGSLQHLSSDSALRSTSGRQLFCLQKTT